MKIAFFTDSFREDLGGLTRAVIALHDRLVRAGHAVRVFTLPQTGGPIHPGDVRRVRAVPLQGLPGLPPDSHLAWDFWQVRRELAAWRPAVVHLHTVLPVSWLGLLAAKSLGIPTVATYHANVWLAPAMLPAGQVPGSLKAAPGRTAGPTSGGAVGSAVQKALGRAVGVAAASVASAFYRRCDAVIAPSRYAAAELRRLGARRPIAVISNGVDLDRFAPAAETRPGASGTPAGAGAVAGGGRGAGRPVTVLFVGRLSPEKGVDCLVQALAVALEAEPTLRARVVGDGPLAGAVRQALAPWIAAGRVVLRGYISWETIPGEYAAGDILLFPSPAETQGLAALEAMAAGLPVVAVRAGALPELVRDGVSGLTAPPGDAEALAQAVLLLARNPDLRRRLGDGARAVARAHEAGRTLGQVLALYARLADTGPGGKSAARRIAS